MSEQRDRETIDRFLVTYVDLEAKPLVGDEIALLPLDYVGAVDDLALEDWDTVPIGGLAGVLALGLSSPPRAFTVYLRARAEWCGAILCFARTGEITFGVSVDDPHNTAERLNVARDLLSTLYEQAIGSHGWVVHEMPPSLDPQRDRPWDDSFNSATVTG